MSLIVYGIPTCTTCKNALRWLREREIAHEFINTKDRPPDRDTIAHWVKTLGFKPMRNTSGQSYRALGETKTSWADEEWIAAFVADAMLLKRPLFVKDGEAVLVGFKEAAVRELFGI